MEIREKISELLNDECYDICEEFEPASVAVAVETIISELEQNLAELRTHVATCEFGRYTFKVSNRIGGFVSCSDENGTGVSETLYYPYYYDEDGDGLKNLIEMMNEAFYHCVN